MHPPARVRHGVAQRAGPGVELDRRRGHEAAAGQHAAAVVGEPAVDQREQAGDAGLTARDRVPHLAREVRDRALEGRDLQFLLAAEQAVQAALAHRHLVGEAADCQAFEPLDRGAADGCLEHLGARVGDAGSRTARHFGVA